MAFRIPYALRRLHPGRSFSTTAKAEADYSHTVIGGGVVGLAIAAELSKVPTNRVLLLEKHLALGQETTSRNSEVIHAGLYYPPTSLKTRLCIEGNRLLYGEAQAAGVAMRQCGKWIVAQSETEAAYLTEMYDKATRILGVPVEMMDLATARELEPNIKIGHAVLSSPTTGIVSAHSLMEYLEAILQKNDGDIALGSEVVGLARQGSGYTIAVRDVTGEAVLIESEGVVNAAGLYAPALSNMLLDRHTTPYYAKGNYFSFTGKAKVDRLIYPCPTPHVASLGTHLTLDLGGQIKFGPDLEWVNSPTDYEVSETNMDAALAAIGRYFPAVTRENLTPSYSGIRPKLAPATSPAFQDFVIQEEPGYAGFVNCLGIESPGLTASMAIAKYVRAIYH